jgi:LPXTG-site transpeptidase (sortase) family protein
MRRVLLLAGYLVGMAVVGFSIIFLIPRFVGHRSTKATATPFAVTATSIPTVAATSTATPLPESKFPAAHLVIPSLNLNAAWVPIGYLSDGLTMDSPAGPKDLGWYDFSGQPGGPSNAVFSGHVDWYTGEPAIFASVHNMKPGDEIDVSRADGKLRTYKVVSADLYDFETTDATPIIAPTDVPTVTLITCEGTFNPVTHEYDKRLVVKATAPAGAN